MPVSPCLCFSRISGCSIPRARCLPMPETRAGKTWKPLPPGCGKPETPDVWDETEVRYGKLLLEMRHPVLREYLLREEAIRLQILDGLLGQSGERITGRKRELEEELEYIRKGLKHYAV